MEKVSKEKAPKLPNKKAAKIEDIKVTPQTTPRSSGRQRKSLDYNAMAKGLESTEKPVVTKSGTKRKAEPSEDATPAKKRAASPKKIIPEQSKAPEKGLVKAPAKTPAKAPAKAPSKTPEKTPEKAQEKPPEKVPEKALTKTTNTRGSPKKAEVP